MRATKHSKTALVIAKSAVVAARDPLFQTLQTPGTATVSEWFVRDYASDYRWLQAGWYRDLLARLESWVLPGVQLHYLARKRLIEQEVEQAIGEGVEQVVVIAGGFDTLCYRLHTRFFGVRFVELDHPATQTSKRKSLHAHGATASNFMLSPVDLAVAPLASALKAAGIDPQRPTMVIAEGVLMYLDRERVTSLVAAVAAFFERGLRLAITFMVPDRAGRRRFHNSSRVLDAWLLLAGERFLSAFTHAELSQLLEQSRLYHHQFWDEQRLRNEVLPETLRDLPIAIGEHVCVARRDG